MRKCSRKKIVDERVTNSYLLCLTIMQNDALSPFYVPGFSAGAGFVFFFYPVTGQIISPSACYSIIFHLCGIAESKTHRMCCCVACEWDWEDGLSF